MGQTVVGGDVMDDVAALDACGTCARVARACSGAYRMARVRVSHYGDAWEARIGACERVK